ncbi:MAG: DUF433 domain-containing protein [Planctomycetes bacterium]|nr:DUF433 domain-containing protein [Planctomycetota bacterium]
MSLQETLSAQSPPLRMDDDGVVRVAGTRVTLDTLVGAYESGATPEEIVQAYDSLSLADVHAVISHYLRHRAEVEEYLSCRREITAQVRERNAKRFPQQDVRRRLLARRKGNG